MQRRLDFHPRVPAAIAQNLDQLNLQVVVRQSIDRNTDRQTIAIDECGHKREVSHQVHDQCYRDMKNAR